MARFRLSPITGAHPGFPIGGGANPQRRGCQHTILPNFPQNCMEMRTFWAVWGGAGASPLRSTTGFVFQIK